MAEQAAAALVNGRYRIVRTLGEGGMGAVYLVADLAFDGRPVALKKIRHSGQHSTAGEPPPILGAEFEAMTRLRHPNVIEVYDFDTDKATGENFLTLEYVEGSDIQESAAGLPLPAVIELFVQVCRGLEYIHARGLIHNDLKPQNIMVTLASPATCKLMDFGMAGRPQENGDAGSAASRGIRGTIQYLSPEAVRGAPPDKRSDIYSLGVVFYRVLTGRLPFAGEPGEYLRRAATEAPAPLRQWRPDLPEALEAVVTRMLSKIATDRPASAVEVIKELSAATGISYAIETTATRASYAASGSFVGRGKELDKLLQNSPGAGRMVLLSGESGVGKSRLIRQLRQEIQMRGGAFALGQCYDGSASAFHPFVQILRQVIPSDLHDAILAPLMTPGQRESSTGRDGENPDPEPDPEKAQQRLLEAGVQAILGAASARTLVVCIEDLQWADNASFQMLEHLARNASALSPQEAGAGLLVVATCRLEDSASPPLSAALPKLLKAASWERMELSRLSGDETAQMLAGIFGLDSAPAPLVSLILGETEGNPFFVQVAVESLIEEQDLARPGVDWLTDGEALSRISFPISITDAIARRLARQTPEEARVLQAIAVGERPIDERLLRAVLMTEQDAASVAGTVEGLARRRLAAREIDTNGVIRLRIDHVKIRDFIYESMDWDRRRELHGRFGLALEECGATDVEELAHHFINSPDAKKALLYAEQAGLHALRLCATERATRFLERACELVPPAGAPHRLTLQLDLANAYKQGRDNPRAIDTCERIIKGARAAGLKKIAWVATNSLVDVLWRAGQHDEAARVAQRVIPTLRAEGEKRILAGCLSSLANIAASRARMDEAGRLQKETLALRREIDDKHGIAACLNNLAMIEMLTDPTQAAKEMLDESLAIRRELSDHQRAAEVLGNLGLWHRFKGELSVAAARLEEAADFARKHRDRWLLGQTQANLAVIYRTQGRMDTALAAAREAASSARCLGDEALECEALDYLGMTERDLGRTVDAAATHEQAAATARRGSLATQEAYALASLVIDRPDAEPRSIKEHLRRAARSATGNTSAKLHARLMEAGARSSLAAGDVAQALEQARAAMERATEGNLPEARVSAVLVACHCLLAGGGLPAGGGDQVASSQMDPLVQAAEFATHAADVAQTRGLVEETWQAFAVLAEIARRSGRRSAGLRHLASAAEILDRTARGIADERIRQAYLSEPRRADLRRSAAILPKGRAQGPAGSPESTPARTLAALYEISSIINSMSDLDALLERVLDVGLAIVGAERGLITLLDETTGEQQVRAARDLEEETVRDALAYSHSVVKEAAAGRIMVALDAASDDRLRDFKSVRLYEIKSLMCVPMKMRDRITGTVYVDSRRQGVHFTDEDLRFLEAFSNLAASAVEQARLQEKLASENVYLRREAGERNQYHNIIGKSVKMQGVYDLMEKVASSTLPVLILGESGTGKELVARALHYSGPRRTKKFFSENVAAIPDTLLESEMFGHMRGAFTGADRDRKGLFELADGGTLFLDEIGDMSIPMQSKLLRALQDGEIRPVGGKETHKVDVRVISATNKDLDRMMKEGRFREDLFYRLNVVRVTLPPLRERKEDIPLLVDHFLRKAGREPGAQPKRVEVGALQLLLRYSWPGNVRELENELLRLAVLAPGAVITQRDVMDSRELFDKITTLDEKDSFTPLEAVERLQIEKALMEAAGNRARAAEMLGISRATIFRKLRKFRIAH